MKVFFIEDFYKNIKAGDLINVSKGFARNYLIPNFIAFIFNKNINSIYFKKLILFNDFKKKKFLEILFNNFNNKNIYLKNLNFISKNFFLYKNFLFRKIGFYYYNYYIIFFKKLKDKYILNIKLYNNFFIKFFIFFI